MLERMHQERIAAEEALGACKARLSSSEASEGAARAEMTRMDAEITKLLAEVLCVSESVSESVRWATVCQ